MIFKDINTRDYLNEGTTDSSADTVYSWAEKLFKNFHYLERIFGTGVLEGGDAHPVFMDTTRTHQTTDLVDSTKTGLIVFETPMKAQISGKKITFDSTDKYRIRFSGWQWTPIWKAYRQGSKGRDMEGPNQPPFCHHNGLTYVKFMSDPIYDGRFVYFWNRTAFFRFDTEAKDDFTLIDPDMTHAWDCVDVRDLGLTRLADNVGGLWEGAVYKGGYIYFAPHTSYHAIRFKVGDGFKVSSAWQEADSTNIIYSRNKGGNDLRMGGGNFSSGYFGACEDGEYIYFAPYNENHFARFNHLQAERHSLTYAEADTTCWELIAQERARSWKDPDNGNMRSFEWKNGSNVDYAFMGCVFDPTSNCVYYAPYFTGADSQNGFVRFNKRLSSRKGFAFQDRTCWESISMRDAYGTNAPSTYFFSGVARFGHFIYFQEERSGYICRFDVRKEWDATEAMKLDTTTGFEWLKISDYLPDGPNLSAAAQGGKPLVADRLYFNSYNWKRLFRMKDTTSWVTRYHRRGATFMEAPESDWEYISTDRIVSPGWRSPMQTDRTHELEVFATKGIVYADGNVYYQPYTMMTRWKTAVQSPTPNDWNNKSSVPVRYNIVRKFNWGQDEPRIIGLHSDAAPKGRLDDFFEYKLRDHYWAAPLSATVTDVRKKFTDTSALLPLWLAVTDEQRGQRITYLKDVRNVIPETRKSIGKWGFKGTVDSLASLPLTGNRNGDIYLVSTSSSSCLYMWYDLAVPVAGSHHYWYPLFPAGMTKEVFSDIRFESRDGILRGVINVDQVEDTLTFKRMNFVDYSRGQGSKSDQSVEMKIDINADLDFHFHNILGASVIDSSGMLRIDGILRVDGTANIHGNIDATNIDFDREITAEKIIIERGNYAWGQDHFRIGDLNILSPPTQVEIVDFVTNNLTVKKPGWPDNQTYGLIHGINICQHGHRHIVSHAHAGTDGTSADVIDATNLPGVSCDLQVGRYLMGYEIRGVPDATQQLQFDGKYWVPTFVTGMT